MLRPRLRLSNRSWCTFQVCAMTGLLLGASLAFALARSSGLSVAVVAMLLERSADSDLMWKRAQAKIKVTGGDEVQKKAKG